MDPYRVRRIGSGLEITTKTSTFHVDKDGEIARHDGNPTRKTDVNTVIDVLSRSIGNDRIGAVNAWAQRHGL